MTIDFIIEQQKDLKIIDDEQTNDQKVKVIV